MWIVQTLSKIKRAGFTSVFSLPWVILSDRICRSTQCQCCFLYQRHDHENENISTIVTSVAYTAKEQFIFPVASSIWTRNNEFNILTDWRYLKYPSETFGLGGYTKQDSFYTLDYYYLKLHQAILKKLATNFYAGLGYDFDFFWDIQEVNAPPGGETDFAAIRI